ncbi:hypothetical protein HDU98_012329 [Podochytrium sp. JEL0797]|nr:hypothetical protein HDU98_012329 [Podochytrium sp. JEL0797]
MAHIHTLPGFDSPVFELVFRGKSVLRRDHLLAINGSQLLSLVEKDEKALLNNYSKETITGSGRFEGVWINKDDALALATQIGIEKLIRFLIEFDPATNPTAEMKYTPIDNASNHPAIPPPTRRAPAPKRPAALEESDSESTSPNKKPSLDDKHQKSLDFLLSLFLTPNNFIDVSNFPSHLDPSTPLDVQGNTAFHWAVSLAHPNTLHHLLSFSRTNHPNLDPNAPNYAGETPLMRAMHVANGFANNCFKKVLDLLVSTVPMPWLLFGAKDLHQKTAFHHAVESVCVGRVGKEVCAAYLDAIREVCGADGSADRLHVNDLDWNQDSCVQMARRGIPGCAEILAVLKLLGADVDSIHVCAIKEPPSRMLTPYPLAPAQPEPQQPLNESAFPTPDATSLPLFSTTHPTFQATTTTTQTRLLELMHSLTATYTTALAAKSRAVVESDTTVASMREQVDALRRQNRDLRSQSVKMAEVVHRIGVIERGVQEEKNRIMEEENAREEEDVAMNDVVEAHPMFVANDGAVKFENGGLESQDLTTLDVAALEARVQDLQARFNDSEQLGKRLAQETMALRVHGGYSENAMNMRKIIAFSCQVPMEQMDSYLEPLILALQNGEAAGLSEV